MSAKGDGSVSAEAVDRVLRSNNYDQSHLVGILQQVQSELNYLPEDALHLVADGLGISIARVYAVATFYKSFSLEPRGKHTVCACVGTACHVRGGQRVVQALESELGVKAGETTRDLEFTLETVNCLGACALGPVVVLDGEYSRQITPNKVGSLLRTFRKGA
jgi:NADH-quinone oxidoreductase subunit E